MTKNGKIIALIFYVFLFDFTFCQETYSFNDPNKSRYFFAPSAYPIGHEQTYFRDTWVFFPSFGYGVSDNLSIEGGMSIFPGGTFEQQAKLFSLKYSLDKINDNEQWASGLFYIGGSTGGIGIIFATVTRGNIDSNGSFSFGLGFLNEGHEIEFATNPTLVLSGKHRLSETISLVSENWIFTGIESDILPLVMNFGVRFFGKHITIDLSGLTSLEYIIEEGLVMPIPMIDFSYHF